MSMELYEKIVNEYSAMGGGALLLTPIVGEFFVDKKCLDRIEVARKYTNIGTISVTSNGIALDRIGVDGWEYFIRHTNFLQISIGGLTPSSYYEMYRVDKFHKVRSNIINFATIRNRVNPHYPMRLAFRVNTPKEEILANEDVKEFKQLGWEIHADNTFANWGGVILDENLPGGATLRHNPPYWQKRNPCFVFYLGLYISSSGVATACGCMDSELVLAVGDCKTQTLSEIWRNQKWTEMWESFGTEVMPEICKQCSMYEDGVKFSLKPEVMNFVSGRFPFGY